MIRIALFALGFIAITLALVLMQPGAPRRAGDAAAPQDQSVSRNDPDLTSAFAPVPDDAPAPRPAVQIVATPSPAPSAPATAPEDLRRLTWDTLAHLNAATGRNSAPGQPGSLLHAIVRRSLDAGPGARPASALPDSYTVRDGDTLVSIADTFYGDVNMTGPLFAANQALLTRPDDLRAGQVLSLPKP